MSNLFTDLQSERQKQQAVLQQEGNQPATQETSKQASQPVSQPPSQESSWEPSPPTRPGFYKKQTFEFGPTEADFLEQAKFECRRQYGLAITKNEIVRAALEFLANDYQENKATSFLVRKFAGKLPR